MATKKVEEVKAVVTEKAAEVAKKVEPAKKAVAKKAETVKKVVAEKTEEVAKKAEPVKKAVTKKVEPAKKAVEKAIEPAKKAVAKKDAVVFLQFAGKEINTEDIVAAAKKAYAADNKAAIKEITLYVKPEDNAAYYVVNGDVTGKVEL